jgi:hypothetical protein
MQKRESSQQAIRIFFRRGEMGELLMLPLDWFDSRPSGSHLKEKKEEVPEPSGTKRQEPMKRRNT